MEPIEYSVKLTIFATISGQYWSKLVESGSKIG